MSSSCDSQISIHPSQFLSKHTIPEKKGNKKPLTKEQKEFLYDKNNNRIVRTVKDFKRGLRVPGKLMPKRILGGIVLNEGYYEMR